MHDDAITAGQRVLIVDDLLATGGTAQATVDLVKQVGGIGRGRLALLIELIELDGRAQLAGETVTHRARVLTRYLSPDCGCVRRTARRRADIMMCFPRARSSAG